MHYFDSKALSFIYPTVDFAEALNLFPAHNDRYNDVQNMLLSLSQLQEDRQHVRKFLTSNFDSYSQADFEHIDNSITKTMKNVFLSVISSIADPILNGIITVLLFLSLFCSVVLTILSFKYFIPIGFAKIRDGKTHARSERVVTDSELLPNNDNQL